MNALGITNNKNLLKHSFIWFYVNFYIYNYIYTYATPMSYISGSQPFFMGPLPTYTYGNLSPQPPVFNLYTPINIHTQ